MTVYVIVSDYFDNGFFGTYSSIKRARIAFEDFLATDEDIISFEDIDDYGYQFTTACGAIFGADILYDVIDAEFVEGIVKED